ncbi:MAG: OsmC family protein [Candidatus Nanopelagicales bacterium]
MPTRHATTHWTGDLMSGSGSVSLNSSNAGDFPVSFPSRAGEPEGQTSPEELIAAAHSACYSMSLAHALAQAGTPVLALDVDASVTLGRDETGFVITSIVLRVTASVPGVSEQDFQAMAQQAKESCPVSRALAAVPEISLEASLDS